MLLFSVDLILWKLPAEVLEQEMSRELRVFMRSVHEQAVALHTRPAPFQSRHDDLSTHSPYGCKATEVRPKR